MSLHKYILAFITITLVLCTKSCTKPDAPAFSESKILLKYKNSVSVKSRAEEEFRKVDVLIFSNQGWLIKHETVLSSGEFNITLPKEILTIAVIVNVFNLDISVMQTLENTMETVCSLYDESDIQLISTGIVTVNNTTALNLVEIPLKRVVSKLTFLFDKSRLDNNVSLSVKSIELFNVPTVCKLFSESCISEGNSATEGDKIFYNTEPMSHSDATPFYMLENLQGVDSDILSQNNKSPSGDQSLYTYALITADYQSPAISGEVVYKYYPGENSTNSFNIPRDSHIKQSVSFIGTAIAENSVRVDISRLVASEYYISASALPAEGGVISGSGKYCYGSHPALEVFPNEGYRFDGWSPPITTVTGNAHYTANFSEVDQDITVNSIILSQTEILADIGEQIYLSCIVLPENADDKQIVWTSDNHNVATVSQSGVITAVSPGQTTVRATNALSNVSSECIVRVFELIEVKVEKYINYQYDQLSGEATSATVIFYLRAQLPVPSDMSIVRSILPFVTVNAKCIYTNNGLSNEELMALSLGFSNNNDTPWIFTEGSSSPIYFHSDWGENNIDQSLESIEITINHNQLFTGGYHIVW